MEGVEQVLNDWVEEQARAKGLTRIVQPKPKPQLELGEILSEGRRGRIQQLELERRVLEEEADNLRQELLLAVEEAAKANGDPAVGLFAEDTARGFQLLRVLSRRFDVVVIDKISVRFVETHDKYWARLSNLNLDFINIDEQEVRRHDRLLLGGIWAEVELGYDETFIFKGVNRPFFVKSIRPIQLSNLEMTGFIQGRNRFAPAEGSSGLQAHELQALLATGNPAGVQAASQWRPVSVGA